MIEVIVSILHEAGIIIAEQDKEHQESLKQLMLINQELSQIDQMLENRK